MLEDQARGLRMLAEKREMRIVAVSSGKGGVGKTNITINLAIAMAQLGKKVVVLDGDLGLANIDVICGLTPKFTIEDVVIGHKALSEILIEGPKGIKILPGGSGNFLADLGRKQLQNLIDKLAFLETVADILLIDTGAGISNQVVDLLKTADEVIVVATPEPTSLTDAYGLVKTLLSESKEWNIGILVNRVRSKDEANTTFTRLESAVQRFLKYSVKYLGFVYEDHFINKSVMRQTPFVVAFPLIPASQCIGSIAEELVGAINKSRVPGKGIRGLLQGLMVRLNSPRI